MSARAGGERLVVLTTIGADMRLKALLISAIVVLAVPLALGCGDDDDNGDGGQAEAPAQTTTKSSSGGDALTINMSEFAFDPQDVVAKAGNVTISAPNDGDLEHELVLLKTDADPAALPMKGGEVDESTSVGEIADVEAGATKEGTFKLTPGKYAMVCALPGHYEGGMYGSLTVK